MRRLGIRTKDFCGVFPFWGLLERLESCNPYVQASLAEVSKVRSLNSPLAKSRAWIREALNVGALDAMLMDLAQHHHLDVFYSDEAIVRVESSFTSMVRIKYFPCMSVSFFLDYFHRLAF